MKIKKAKSLMSSLGGIPTMNPKKTRRAIGIKMPTISSLTKIKKPKKISLKLKKKTMSY